MPVVRLQNVSKSFNTQQVIDHLNLEVHKGEFLTLLGPSGCGKTTVLRLIAGLETCDTGSVFINGRDQTRLPACDRDVNTVFQSYALFPHMNVFDNIAFGLTLKKIPARQIRAGPVRSNITGTPPLLGRGRAQGPPSFGPI